MRKRNPFSVFPSADSITPSVTDQQYQTLWNMREEKKINKALDYCLLVNQDDLEGDCTEGKKKLKTEAQLLDFYCGKIDLRSEIKSVDVPLIIMTSLQKCPKPQTAKPNKQ